MGKLTATAVKQTKASSKNTKLSDGGGLYLLVTKGGGKYWRYDYRFAGKRKTLAIGTYPDVTLLNARKRHQSAREDVANDLDPSAAKKAESNQAQAVATFRYVGEEWFAQKMADKSDNYKKRASSLLIKDIYPVIGALPICNVTPLKLLEAFKKIEQRGAIEMAHRAKQLTSLIFRYAIITGRTQNDPSAALNGALKSRTKKHHAAVTSPKELKNLLIAIDNYQGTAVVRYALQISPLLFQRPGEIRHMEWEEINWNESRWEIPGNKMKMRSEHIIPLSKQTLSILRDVEMITGGGRYVFPSARGLSRPISENAVRTALRTIGYSNEEMTPHGFRATARTILDEVLNFRVDYIEHQLAHAVKDPTGRAYNRTSFLPQRKKMMQQWSDYLDQLRK